MTRTPARRAVRSKLCEMACGWIGSPLVSVNIQPRLSMAAARCSVCCQVRQAEMTSTVVASRSMRRRAVAGLAACLLQLVGDGDEPAVDRDGRGCVVVVVPAEAEQLVATHPGEGRDPEGGKVAVASRFAQELLEFWRAPGLLLDPRDRAQP